MYIKTITLSFDEAIGGFPQEPLERVMASGNLLEVRDHFFLHKGIPRMAFAMKIFLAGHLKVEIKQERIIVAPCSEGVPFLGWHV